MTTIGPNVIPSNLKILKGSAVSGTINAVVNGTIQLFLLPGTAMIPVTVNGISNEQHTLLGAAVPLAVSLAMILTLVAYATLKAPKRSFVPTVLWLTIKHGIFAFCLVVSCALFWLRVMDEVSVTRTTAVLILGLIAGLVAGVVNYMTIKASLLASSPT